MGHSSLSAVSSGLSCSSKGLAAASVLTVEGQGICFVLHCRILKMLLSISLLVKWRNEPHCLICSDAVLQKEAV